MLWVGKWELEINLSNFNVWPRPRQVLCVPYMIVCADVWLSKHPGPLGLCTAYTGGGWLPVFKVHYKNTRHRWKFYRCLQIHCPFSSLSEKQIKHSNHDHKSKSFQCLVCKVMTTFMFRGCWESLCWSFNILKKGAYPVLCQWNPLEKVE